LPEGEKGRFLGLTFTGDAVYAARFLHYSNNQKYMGVSQQLNKIDGVLQIVLRQNKLFTEVDRLTREFNMHKEECLINNRSISYKIGQILLAGEIYISATESKEFANPSALRTFLTEIRANIDTATQRIVGVNFAFTTAQDHAQLLETMTELKALPLFSPRANNPVLRNTFRLFINSVQTVATPPAGGGGGGDPRPVDIIFQNGAGRNDFISLIQSSYAAAAPQRSFCRCWGLAHDQFRHV
jgi:hypothetical protein